VIVRLLDAYVFVREFLRGFREDRLFEKGAFLAYLSLVAFIPLLASFVQVYSLFYRDYEEQIRAVVTQVLPYQEDAWFAYFNEFLAQAKSLGTLALIFCFAVAVKVFLSIEGIFNVIWGLDRRRRLAERVGSFTMMLFWGPIALGLLASVHYYLVRAGALAGALEFLVPKVLTFLAFTMLFKTVPAVHVRLLPAALGGLVTMVLLTLVKYGFVAYMAVIQQANVVSGSLGLILLFVISIDLFWMTILTGVLTSYTLQNFRALKSALEEREVPLERWELFWGLSIATLMMHRFRAKLPPVTVAELADLFNLEVKRLEAVTAKLKARGLVLESDALALGFARDPSDLTVGDLAKALLHEQYQRPPVIPNAHPKAIRGALEELEARLGGDAGAVPLARLAEGYAAAAPNGAQGS
jgi:membrane protein